MNKYYDKSDKKKRLLECSEAPRKLRCLLTGFGKFQGVETNPTERLVRRLEKKKHFKSRYKDIIVETRVLEVSVKDCQSLPDADVYVHLGINYRGTGIQLEQYAYNNMSFRIPDEQGYQPNRIPIHEDKELDEPMPSGFHLARAKHLVTQELKLSRGTLTLSKDPGRFLCNYVYARALDRSPLSLFIHVPPEEVIPLDRQLVVVEKIVDQLMLQAQEKGQ